MWSMVVVGGSGGWSGGCLVGGLMVVWWVVVWWLCDYFGENQSRPNPECPRPKPRVFLSQSALAPTPLPHGSQPAGGRRGHGWRAVGRVPSDRHRHEQVSVNGECFVRLCVCLCMRMRTFSRACMSMRMCTLTRICARDIYWRRAVTRAPAVAK